MMQNLNLKRTVALLFAATLAVMPSTASTATKLQRAKYIVGSLILGPVVQVALDGYAAASHVKYTPAGTPGTTRNLHRPSTTDQLMAGLKAAATWKNYSQKADELKHAFSPSVTKTLTATTPMDSLLELASKNKALMVVILLGLMGSAKEELESGIAKISPSLVFWKGVAVAPADPATVVVGPTIVPTPKSKDLLQSVKHWGALRLREGQLLTTKAQQEILKAADAHPRTAQLVKYGVPVATAAAVAWYAPGYVVRYLGGDVPATGNCADLFPNCTSAINETCFANGTIIGGNGAMCS